MTCTNDQTSHVHHADRGADNDDTSRPQRATHQEFHWIEGTEQGSPYANFVETTLDITAGIHACLQIAYAADLERQANLDAFEEDIVIPAVGIVESDQLVRMSIAAVRLLREEARRRVEVLSG